MKTALVTGANGFIGQAVATELIRQKFNVLCATRSAFQLAGAKALIVPDLAMHFDWSGYLAGVDCVIHTAARVHVMAKDDAMAEEIFYKVNVLATLQLAQAAADNGVRRFIFLSTVKVNGEGIEAGKPFTEDDTPNPRDSYSISKYQAEEGLFAIARQTGLEIVIIRPSLVYGPGVQANFASLLTTLQKRIPLPFGSINNRRSLLYIGNLVSLIVLCINHPKAANQVFLAADGCDVSTTELLKACADALGLKAILVPVPQSWLTFGARLTGKQALAQRLCGSLQVDISKAKRLLGWQPPFSIVEGLQATVGLPNTD